MTTTNWRTAKIMLICGAIILAISIGIRHSFGLFLQPLSMANGWGRETFSFAIALQNLVWGAAGPFLGALADRIGAGKVILGGAVLYALGLLGMAQPSGATAFILSAGVLVGLGLSGTTFSIVFGAISRSTPAEGRSLAFGIAMSACSFGQFVMLPGALMLLDGVGWSGALVVLSMLSTLMLPLAFALFEHREPAAVSSGPSVREACREAWHHRDCWLLSLGFFVCGFQVIFISTHIPAFLADRGMSASVATTVLALIGLLNIVGSLLAGYWGARYRKSGLLVWIYLARGAAIALFVLMPITPWSSYTFGAVMGLLWLSTVPLTNGLVAEFFDVKNMSMLSGITFFAHQCGSFLGGWLGGRLYDAFGSYNIAWAIAIGLSVIAAALNAGIRKPIIAPATAKEASA